MQFIVAMYCDGVSGAAASTRMRGRILGPLEGALVTRLMSAAPTKDTVTGTGRPGT